MSNRPSLDDYVDVAERIQDFKDAHPDGSLQTLGWEVVTVEGYDRKANAGVKTTFIVYRAAAFRDSTDTAPGHGIAWEPFPGGTPYTKDSELMNAETAAWGRAIIALGLVANRSLASRQEVRNRRADQEAEAESASKPVSKSKPAQQPMAPKAAAAAPTVAKDASGAQEIVNDITLEGLRKTIRESGKSDEDVAWLFLSVGVESLPENPSREDLKAALAGLTVDQALRLDGLLTDSGAPGSGEAA